jgi:hypothetical protein
MEEEIKTILIQKLKEKGARKFNGFTIGLHANHIANALLKKKGIKKDSAEYEAEHAKLKELVKKVHKDLPAQEVSKTPPSPSPAPAPAPEPAPAPAPEPAPAPAPTPAPEPTKLKTVKTELKRLQKYLETSRPDELMSVAQEIQKYHKMYRDLKEGKDEKKAVKAEKKELKTKEKSATKIQTAFKRSKQVKEAKGKLEELKKEFIKGTPEQERLVNSFLESKATATKEKAFNVLKQMAEAKRKERIIENIGQDEYDRLGYDGLDYSEYDLQQSKKKSVSELRSKEFDEISEKYLKGYKYTRGINYGDSNIPRVMVFKKGKSVIQLRYYVGQNTWHIFEDDKDTIHYSDDKVYEERNRKEEEEKAKLNKKQEDQLSVLNEEGKKAYYTALNLSRNMGVMMGIDDILGEDPVEALNKRYMKSYHPEAIDKLSKRVITHVNTVIKRREESKK